MADPTKPQPSAFARMSDIVNDLICEAADHGDVVNKAMDLIAEAVQAARAEWEADPLTRSRNRLADKYSVAAAALLAEEEAKALGGPDETRPGQRDRETCSGPGDKVDPGRMHVDGLSRHVAVPELRDAERIEEIMTMHPALLQPEAIELRNEVARLRIGWGLLGVARMVLDQVANGGMRGWVQAQRDAGALAQRIVDEIGHSVTDEPALGPEYRAEIRQLRADLAKARSDLAGWRAAYEVLSAKTRRFQRAWRSARRGRRKMRARWDELREEFTYYVGPVECVERDCEEYFDDDGSERADVAWCTHVRPVTLTFKEHIEVCEQRNRLQRENDRLRGEMEGIRRRHEELNQRAAEVETWAADPDALEERARLIRDMVAAEEREVENDRLADGGDL